MPTHAFLQRTLVIVASISCALVIAACGPADVGGPAGIVPKRAAVVVEVDLGRGKKDQFSQLRTVLKRVPVYGIADRKLPAPQQVIDQLLVAAEAKPNQDWEEEVRPWLGDAGGAAGWYDGDKGEGVDALQYFAWLQTEDEEQALASAREAWGKPVTQTYRQVELHRGRSDAKDVHWAVVEGRLVVAADDEPLKEAVRAADGESLEDSGQWEELHQQREGNDALVSVVLTPRLWEQARVALDDRGDLVGDEQARRQVENALDRYSERLDFASLSLGATGDGLWLDLVAIGDPPVDEVERGQVREDVEALPASAVIAAATGASALDDERLEAARTGLQQAREQFATGLGGAGDGAAGARRAISVFFDAYERLLSEENVQELRQAYGDRFSLGLLARSGELALVTTSEVEDRQAAEQQFGKVVGIIDRVLRSFSSARAAAVEGGEHTTLRVSGIPAQRARKAIEAGVEGQARAKLRTHPLLREFLRPTLEGAVVTTDEQQLFGFPTWGLVELQAAVGEDAQTLADNADFTRDMKAAAPDDDAAKLFWMDIDDLVVPLVQPIDARVSFILEGQLSHIGGPVIWSTSREDGGETVSRTVVEVPLYE